MFVRETFNVLFGLLRFLFDLIYDIHTVYFVLYTFALVIL